MSPVHRYLNVQTTTFNAQTNKMIKVRALPEENGEGVDVDAVVVLTREQLWRHVNGRANNTSAHHSFRLAKSQVRQQCTLSFIQLQNTATAVKRSNAKLVHTILGKRTNTFFSLMSR